MILSNSRDWLNFIHRTPRARFILIKYVKLCQFMQLLEIYAATKLFYLHCILKIFSNGYLVIFYKRELAKALLEAQALAAFLYSNVHSVRDALAVQVD